MAKPIQPTPTLEGKDAENFYNELARVKTKREIEERRKRFERADKIFRMYGKDLIRRMLS